MTTPPLLLDEHVPRVLEHTFDSSGYETVRADERFEPGTDDEQLFAWCRANGHVLCSNDRDFVSMAEGHDHAGVLLYTDQAWVRTHPRDVLNTVDYVVAEFGSAGLDGQIVWLEAWRDAR
ncbi:DUF5615 family PIN-like protein [Halovivax cerinus]|uniref:DUF5615 family PIN-like protein n=1 Tax=Halovivax cerinus TaxID=1487865 RepID=A0ABD5NPU2_9EURY|nr:DUF5615 family PIN-like protein [Halovivax cerinus]